MKSFKKILSLVLAVCMLASIVSVAAVTASANAGDVQHRKLISEVLNSEPDNQVETNTYYFYMPESWRNEYNDYYNYNAETKTFDGEGGNFAAGIYWWEGPYNCNDYKGDFEQGWPGYAVTETLAEDANIFKANVPKDAGKFIWNNLVDGGQDKTDPVFYAALQTEDISNEYYDPGEDGYGFYPEGNEDTGFDGMIYVCNPKATEENVLTPGKFTYKGAWFYYYGNGEYSYYKTREEAEANNAIYKNGEFPAYGLDIDVKEATIAGGETVDITPNDSTAVAAVEDPAIASVSQDETGKATIKGLKAGTTKVTFTVDNGGEVDKVEATITVTSDAPETQPAGDETQPVTDETPETQPGEETEPVTGETPETQPAGDETVVPETVAPTDAPATVAPTDAPATVAPTQAPAQNPTNPPKPAVVNKKANPMTVKAVNKTFKAKKLKKKAQTFKAIKVSKAQGKVTYKVTKKNKKLKFKNGKVTVKKKTKKGTYKITVKITAAGNSAYNAKTVKKTIKVKVKK